MSAVFEHLDIHFNYPENWVLSQSTDKDEMPWEISLETPNGGLWMLHVFPHDSNPEDLLANTRSALVAQYEDVEFLDTNEDFLDFSSTGLDAYFYCLDFLVTAKNRIVKTDRYMVALYFQAENREFDNLEDVFMAVTTSLLKDMVTPADGL